MPALRTDNERIHHLTCIRLYAASSASKSAIFLRASRIDSIILDGSIAGERAFLELAPALLELAELDARPLIADHTVLTACISRPFSRRTVNGRCVFISQRGETKGNSPLSKLAELNCAQRAAASQEDSKVGHFSA